ncbi:hypothetical protein ABPG77_002899, partial [Micractinium sp. CCAP 211/92]
CRSAFGGPVEPHLVLGGFPTDASFRNFSADASAFVVTFPIDSHPANRDAALAWEAAFVGLAAGRLTEMAEAAGLRLSFSAERSVQDELARESASDVSTVLASYLVMLLYIAVALGRFPRSPDWRDVLVNSRAGLGLGGVLIVAAAVAGSLGLCSWAGMRSTLIIMEVIPFLVLAVGVDNMFILAAALQQQPERHPLPHRVGLALAAVGPSITLAASCEVVAFALGGLTDMPALRNFSICAALAVLLDFLLQVTAFVALLTLDARRIEQGRYDCWPWSRCPAHSCPYAPAVSSLQCDTAANPGALRQSAAAAPHLGTPIPLADPLCAAPCCPVPRRAEGQPLYDSDYEVLYGCAGGAETEVAEAEVEAAYGHAYGGPHPGALGDVWPCAARRSSRAACADSA